MYYNPNTSEQKTLPELKKMLNASIPPDAEQIGDEWFLIKDEGEPALSDETKKAVKGPIVLINGSYVQNYAIINKTAKEIEQDRIEKAREAMQQAKEVRATSLAFLVIPYNGSMYDANEVAQERMSRVLTAFSDDDGSFPIEWVDADDVVQNITVGDLRNILRIAVEETTRIWVRPYEEA